MIDSFRNHVVEKLFRVHCEHQDFTTLPLQKKHPVPISIRLVSINLPAVGVVS